MILHQTIQNTELLPKYELQQGKSLRIGQKKTNLKKIGLIGTGKNIS